MLLEDTGQGREKLYSSYLTAGWEVVVLPEAQEKRKREKVKMRCPFLFLSQQTRFILM